MSSDNPRILIVDDEEAICDLLCDVLSDQHYDCEAVGNADLALAKLKEHPFEMALVDIKMPGMSGLELLPIMRELYPATMVLMVTAVNDANTAVDAMKNGASDYILKPFTVDDVRERVAAVFERRKSGDASDSATDSSSQNPIDAIAHGVEAQVERFDFHSRIVTEKTVEVAKKLGLPDEAIDDWERTRQETSSVRDKRMEWAVKPKRDGHGKKES